MRTSLPVLLLVAVACTAVPADDEQAEAVLPFWAGPGVLPGANIVEVYDHHACGGQVALARVRRIPPVGHAGPLIPEEVVELDRSGVIIARWPIPIDRFVLAVQGDELVVPGPALSSEPALFVSSDGAFRLFSVPDRAPSPVARSCPDLLEFRGSAYLRCFVFEDLRTHAERSLAFQGPCT
jgi:hypothetical protein